MPKLATPFSQIKKIQRRNLECKEDAKKHMCIAAPFILKLDFQNVLTLP